MSSENRLRRDKLREESIPMTKCGAFTTLRRTVEVQAQNEMGTDKKEGGKDILVLRFGGQIRIYLLIIVGNCLPTKFLDTTIV